MNILNSSELKEWDLYTIEHEKISSLDLMDRAANSCTVQIINNYPAESQFHIIVGKGNNGGDGLIIAKRLHDNNYNVRISILNFNSNESRDFRFNLDNIGSLDLKYINNSKELYLKSDEIIIDAIFGYGLNRIVEGKFAEVISSINSSISNVLSLDIPSGLFVDDNSNNTGAIIKADFTYTFQCLKFSFLLPSYSKYVGNVRVIDIKLHKGFLKMLSKKFSFIEKGMLPSLKKRKNNSHKGDFGHALLIGGENSMKGAIILSAMSVMRSGTGKLSVSLPVDYIRDLNLKFPEAIIDNDLNNFSNYSAIGIGPGLGTSNKSRNILRNILYSRKDKPLVLDADALNIISEEDSLLKFIHGSIITPHLGEFKRLVGDFDSDEEKIKKQINFAMENNIIIVLKGKNTTIANSDGRLFFNSTGNSGMSTAGSGDVLTGIILSFLTQGYNLLDACCLSVFIHGKAADFCLDKESKESLISSDIINNLGKVFKFLRKE